MEQKSHTFLYALKLWLIWNVLADISLVIFIVGEFGLASLCSILSCGSMENMKVLLILMLSLALTCLIIGLIQWSAFIDRIKHSYWWIFATAVGWFVVGISLYLALTNFGDFLSAFSYGTPTEEVLLAGAIVGVVIGSPQWLVLRGKESEGIWWLLLSVLGWACAVYAAYALSQTGMEMIGLVVGLSFMGMITGVAYAYLFTQSSKKNEGLKNEQYPTRSATSGQ